MHLAPVIRGQREAVRKGWSCTTSAQSRGWEERTGTSFQLNLFFQLAPADLDLAATSKWVFGLADPATSRLVQSALMNIACEVVKSSARATRFVEAHLGKKP